MNTSFKYFVSISCSSYGFWIKKKTNIEDKISSKPIPSEKPLAGIRIAWDYSNLKRFLLMAQIIMVMHVLFNWSMGRCFVSLNEIEV